MRFGQLFGKTLRQSPSISNPLMDLALRTALTRLVDERLILLPLGERVNARFVECLGADILYPQSVVMPLGNVEGNWGEWLMKEIQSYRQRPVSLFSRRMIRSQGPHIGLSRPLWIDSLQWVFANPIDEECQWSQELWKDQIEGWWLSVNLSSEHLVWRPEERGWVHISENGPEDLLDCTSCE